LLELGINSSPFIPIFLPAYKCTEDKKSNIAMKYLTRGYPSISFKDHMLSVNYYLGKCSVRITMINMSKRHK